jgi:serine protease Do
MKSGLFGSRVMALVLAVALGPMVADAAAPKTSAGRSSTNPPPKLVIQENAVSREIKGATSLAPIAKKAAPSVVNIYSTTTVKDRPFVHPFLNDPMFRRFFGEDFGGGNVQPRERQAQGLGSGVIVSQDGYILTANHVIEGADSVKISFASGDEEYDATVIGADPPTDIAVLKVNIKKPLPAVTITDSDKLEVGDMVLAVGNPFGIGQTVTVGYVSALSRRGFGITGYEDFIQTDAAINPGNSGGALIDAEGRLVGINTAIISRSGGFQGVGFAVPINMARYVMDRLIVEGRVSRGYLGISIQPLTRELAKEFGLADESSGVLVGGVSPNSAAAKAGLKEGDVVVDVGGRKVSDPQGLQLVIAQTPPGTKVDLRILRGETGGKPTEKILHVTLGELPREFAQARGIPSIEDSGKRDALDGVEVADLDNRTRQQFTIPNNVRGALVTDVDDQSNAAEAGLRPGDVILEINRQPVRSAQDAVDLSEKAEGERILLRVWSSRGGGPGGTRYIVVDNTTN